MNKMKKYFIVFLVLLLVMPFCVNASSYSDSASKAKFYLNNNYSDTFQRYLIDGTKRSVSWCLPSISDASNTCDSSFWNNTYGALLNKDEYLASVADGDTRSYLFDGKAYWTMTAINSSSHYVVGTGNVNNNDTTPATKVTEFVRRDVQVTGRGTNSEPWRFMPKYSILVTAEGTGSVSPVAGQIIDNNGAVIIESAGGNAIFSLTPDVGSGYLYDTCGLTIEPSDVKEINNRKQITFKNITRDISCKVVFGKGLFELAIEESAELKSNIKKLYVRNREQFYKDEDGVYPVNHLSLTLNKRGYNFIGLEYKLPNNTKVIVVKPNGDIDRLKSSNIVGNGTLTQHWEPMKITITLNGNSGQINGRDTSQVDVTYDSEYGTFATPIKTGYDFLGWFTQKNGGTQIISTTKVDIISPITLYAHWKPSQYTLTYQAEGGSVSPTSKIVTYDSEYGDLPNPTRRGFTFTGWYNARTSGTKVTASTIVKTPNNHDIYAYWNRNKYNCAAGTYLAKNAISCSTCIAGYRCPGGEYSFDDTKDQGIFQCGGGTYAAAGASTCANCSAGYYAAAGSSSCSKCSAGYYSSAGATTCTQCPAGSYSANAGSSSCSKCAAGKISNANRTGCNNCPAGSYSASEGSSSCTSCSKGYYQSSAGKTSCTKCPANSYSASTGATSCTSCPSGQVCPAGSTAKSACYKPTVNCRKWQDRSCSYYHDGSPCAASCGRLSCGYYCAYSDPGVYYCSNIWDGCKNFGGGYEAYSRSCTPGKWLYKNNVTPPCPSGYSEY